MILHALASYDLACLASYDPACLASYDLACLASYDLARLVSYDLACLASYDPACVCPYDECSATDQYLWKRTRHLYFSEGKPFIKSLIRNHFKSFFNWTSKMLQTS